MFEWDENKRMRNIRKHGIDFLRVTHMWLGIVIETRSSQTEHDEIRFVATGMIEEICITVVYTWRGQNRRLISARRARDYEREHYYRATR